MTDNGLNDDDALRQVLGPIMPPSHARRVGHAERIELDTERTFRARNKISYRLNHWPIWIWTFFIAPGPLTFDLFARGFDWRMAAWLFVVLVGTGLAGLFGKLPGVEPAPYIIRFTEDRPNPLYRRVCYTFAWSAVVTFAVLNIAGLTWAVITGEWRLRQIYDAAYFPSPAACGCWARSAVSLASGDRPKTRATSAATSMDRCGRSALRSPCSGSSGRCCRVRAHSDGLKLAIFVAVLVWMGNLARRGLLPRTRPIVPGELAISD